MYISWINVQVIHMSEPSHFRTLCCFLSPSDIGKSDLALLPCKICIGDCKLPVRGYCGRSSTLVYIFTFFFGFVKQALYDLHILLCKSIWLWVMQRACNMVDTKCFHDTGECLECIAWSIIWYQGIRPSIVWKHYLALVCNTYTCHWRKLAHNQESTCVVHY